MTSSRQDRIRMLMDSRSGTIPGEDLVQVGPIDDRHMGYRCPCGGRDYLASRAVEEGAFGQQIGPAPVLHCFETGRVWQIDDRKTVESVIRREEERFVALLKQFESSGLVGKSVTAAEAFRLRTERGVPEDMLEVDDMDEYRRLMGEHVSKSRAGVGK